MLQIGHCNLFPITRSSATIIVLVWRSVLCRGYLRNRGIPSQLQEVLFSAWRFVHLAAGRDVMRATV